MAVRQDNQQRGAADSGGMEKKTFNFLVDSVPYSVDVSPFMYNDEVRFYVRVNGGEEHVFTWDSEVRHIRSIDDSSAVLPVGLEEEISDQLQRNIH